MKKFFEVFPTLQLDGNMQDLFGQVKVERISATKRKDYLRIYISSDRLIRKEDILKTEEIIKRQLFPGFQMTVKIYEKYHLSSQYNPEKFMHIYKDSIMLELKDYSPVEYNIFKNADIAYPEENKILLTVEDSVPARSKSEELIRILDKIYNERFGFSVDIGMEFRESAGGKRREEDELKIARQVGEITARARGAQADGMPEEAADMAGKHGQTAGSGRSRMTAGTGGGDRQTAAAGTPNTGGSTKPYEGTARGS